MVRREVLFVVLLAGSGLAPRPSLVVQTAGTRQEPAGPRIDPYAARTRLNCPGADFTTFSDDWVNANIRAKGPLGKHYLDGAPSLTSYRRIIVEIQPEAPSEPQP